MAGLRPDALVGTGVAVPGTGDENGLCVSTGTGVAGTATGAEIVWTDPGTVSPALFCWTTWRRFTLDTLDGTLPVTDADTVTSSLSG